MAGVELSAQDTRRMNRVLRHRLRNFVSGVQNSVKLLSSDLQGRLSSEELEYFPLIINECREIDRLTQRMTYLFDEPAQGADRRLSDILEHAKTTIREQLPTAQIEVQSGSPATDVRLHGSHLLLLALNELLMNALEAKPNGRVEVACELAGDAVAVQVLDDGKGIPEAERPNAALPFHTTRSRHLGIGLSVAERMAWRLGGTLHLYPRLPKGWCAEIRVPAADDGLFGKPQPDAGIAGPDERAARGRKN